MRDSDKLRGPNNGLPEEPARPVEDREPVGPYAHTRNEGGPINVIVQGPGFPNPDSVAAAARRLTESARIAREGQVPSLVAAGMTPTEAAAHVEQLARIAAERDTARSSREWDDIRQAREQQQYREGFRAGVKIGAAETEARALDGQLLDTIETTETLRPEPYDIAARALDVAGRLVKPIDGTTLPEMAERMAEQQARTTTAIASVLYGWLSQFTEPDDPDGPGLSDRYVAAAQGPRCPQPDCGVLLDSTGACTDPWCPSGGAVVGEPVIERVATPEDQQWRPMPDYSGGELVEDGEGAPLPPEQQACPECRQGKHDNCPGRILDETSITAPAALTYTACPCAEDSHPESIGGE